MMGVREAASYINFAVSSVHRLCGTGELPHYKIGNKLSFSKKELTEWRKKNPRNNNTDPDRLLSPAQV